MQPIIAEIAVPFALVIALLAAAGFVVLAAAVYGFRKTLLVTLGVGPIGSWLVARSMEAGALSEFASLINVLRNEDWAILLLLVAACAYIVWIMTESATVTIAFAPTTLLTSLAGAFLLQISNGDVLLGLAGPAVMAVGAILGSSFAMIAVIALLRSAPVRFD